MIWYIFDRAVYFTNLFLRQPIIKFRLFHFVIQHLVCWVFALNNFQYNYGSFISIKNKTRQQFVLPMITRNNHSMCSLEWPDWQGRLLGDFKNCAFTVLRSLLSRLQIALVWYLISNRFFISFLWIYANWSQYSRMTKSLVWRKRKSCTKHFWLTLMAFYFFTKMTFFV